APTPAAFEALGGSFGRDEGGGAEGNNGSNGEGGLAKHGDVFSFLLDAFLTSCPSVGETLPQVHERGHKIPSQNRTRTSANAPNECPGRIPAPGALVGCRTPDGGGRQTLARRGPNTAGVQDCFLLARCVA